VKKAVIAFVILAVIVIPLVLLRSQVSLEYEPEDDCSEEIIAFLGCDYEIVRNARSAAVVTRKYKDLVKRGKTEGFTPLIIVPDSILCQSIYSFADYYDGDHYGGDHYGAGYSPEAIINESESINAFEFLQSRSKYAASIGSEDYLSGIMGERPVAETNNSFISFTDFLTNRPYSVILIAKIPTDKPWELAAWIPMGGFNECPSPAEQVAVFKYWHEQYGAVPVVVTWCTWELQIENLIKDRYTAKTLAKEQFGFCRDIVWQGDGSVDNLANSLIWSTVWFFWWD